MARRISRTVSLAALCASLLSSGMAAAEDRALFDFDREPAVKAFANIDVYALREGEARAAIEAAARAATNPATAPAYKSPASMPSEPAVRIERSAPGADGKCGLKLTFAGGRMPTISAPCLLDDWRPYQGFVADVTASRTCVVVFRAMAQTSKYGTGYNQGVSRWEFAARLTAGRNTVVAPRPEYADPLWKNIKTFQIHMLQPQVDEVITIRSIRLLEAKPKATSPFNAAPPPPQGGYKVLGKDLVVKDVDDLADKLKDKWVKPEDQSVAQVEADIQAQYEKLKKDHPKAVLVMLRDGQKGYDPSKPEKTFAGWEDAGTPSHLPMSLTLACFANAGRNERIETCFRNRPGFLRVDLSSIPKGAAIFAARLIVVRAFDLGNNWQTKPTVFVAEPCNRPWKEYEVNVFEYAGGEFWNDYAGLTWGDDGDCTAVYLAHGPSAGKTLSLDFTHAVKYWTDGTHANQGFILHGSPKYVDYLNIFARECKELKNRPGLAVIYEPVMAKG
jgi:hypothetical protein